MVDPGPLCLILPHVRIEPRVEAALSRDGVIMMVIKASRLSIR